MNYVTLHGKTAILFQIFNDAVEDAAAAVVAVDATSAVAAVDAVFAVDHHQPQTWLALLNGSQDDSGVQQMQPLSNVSDKNLQFGSTCLWKYA